MLNFFIGVAITVQLILDIFLILVVIDHNKRQGNLGNAIQQLATAFNIQNFSRQTGPTDTSHYN